MEPLQILERYYNAFIGQDDPKGFFVGMTDYLDYGDTVAEFDLITSQISLMQKPLMDKYTKQEKAALEKVTARHKEISTYVSSKKIDNPVIKNALREYDAFLDGRASSSAPLPYTLYDELHDVIEALYALPEHRDFALKYAEPSSTDKTSVRQHLHIKELDDFLETKREFERGRENSLWGAQGWIYELREIVHKGRETHKKIVERHKRHEHGATFDLLNFSVILSEWVKIEEERAERDPTFFNPKKVRPLVQRFHMYVVAHFAEAQNVIAQATPQSDFLAFDEKTARLSVKSKAFRIRRVSNQYDLLRVMFSEPSEVGKEWFFSEIAEKADSARPQERLKKYYNAAYQIGLKLAAGGIPDFFITTRHSVRISPTYLS